MSQHKAIVPTHVRKVAKTPQEPVSFNSSHNQGDQPMVNMEARENDETDNRIVRLPVKDTSFKPKIHPDEQGTSRWQPWPHHPQPPTKKLTPSQVTNQQTQTTSIATHILTITKRSPLTFWGMCSQNLQNCLYKFFEIWSLGDPNTSGSASNSAMSVSVFRGSRARGLGRRNLGASTLPPPLGAFLLPNSSGWL